MAIEFYIEFSDTGNYYPVKLITFGDRDGDGIKSVRIRVRHQRHITIKRCDAKIVKNEYGNTVTVVLTPIMWELEKGIVDMITGRRCCLC